ncbi:MAG: GFA family protein [Burkholderiales bacterium]|nr:GFA family protein [Burkholderiales bacterium]
MSRTATCACGQASITVAGEPEMNGVCHCGNCKRRTGSAFGISSYFARDSVTAQQGSMTVYALDRPGEGSSQKRHFCSSCGTTLFWYISTLPALVGVAGGCFAAGELPEPACSANDGQRAPWITLPSSWKILVE